MSIYLLLAGLVFSVGGESTLIDRPSRQRVIITALLNMMILVRLIGQ